MSEYNSGTPARLIWQKNLLGNSVEPLLFFALKFLTLQFPKTAGCRNYIQDFCIHVLFISTKYNTLCSSEASNRSTVRVQTVHSVQSHVKGIWVGFDMFKLKDHSTRVYSLRLKGYSCESGIALFAWRVALNYA